MGISLVSVRAGVDVSAVDGDDDENSNGCRREMMSPCAAKGHSPFC